MYGIGNRIRHYDRRYCLAVAHNGINNFGRDVFDKVDTAEYIG